ncbi:MAG TPA: hypothetical protein VE569_13155, partial [Acidimicrobiia bacterium]|nr:hypothetical protein [Acidimicrobiia bacterium]
MNFSGELKFPDLDHPGIPVQFLIEGDQAELVVEDESLGRWSLYDVHAHRLIASAFQVDLDGTEVTFVAHDPMDFAYRAVDHMANSWATIKAKNVAARSLAIRKSRRGTTPPRLDELREAMEANLETMGTRLRRLQISERIDGVSAWEDHPAQPETSPTSQESGSQGSATSLPEADQLAAERQDLEEERRKLAEERALLDEKLRVAEEREANLVEAFRHEMRRLEAEREKLRSYGVEIDEPDDSLLAVAETDMEESMLPTVEPVADSQPEPAEHQPEPGSVEFEPEASPPVAEPESEPGLVDADSGPVEGELDAARFRRRPSLIPDAAEIETGPTEPVPQSQSDIVAGPRMKRSEGIMGAVRAAFRGGPGDHKHQFIEAPGGTGITRYVCEECG